jgi:hypothetical protein
VEYNNMVRLHFDTADEFEGLFKQKTRKVTDAMVLGIEKAMLENKKSADIFQITFGEEEVAFDISIVIPITPPVFRDFHQYHLSILNRQ